MGLIAVFAGALLIALLTYSGGGSRLSQLETLAKGQGWTIVKTYTNAARGCVVVRVSDFVATIALANERHIGATVRVELPAPGAPIFDIRPSVIGALAGKRIELGPGLHAYSSEPDETRAMFTPARRQALGTLLSDAEVRCDREAIIIVLPPSLALGMVVAALGFAIDLAGADHYGLEVLRALPNAVYRPASSERAAGVELDAPSPIRIAPVREGELVVTQARIESGTAPGIPAAVPELGPAAIAKQSDGSVTITWREIQRDPAPLLAAIELLRAWGGGPHEGAYR